MESDAPLGTIKALWRFPVKSMQGEQAQQVTVTTRGVVGDRAWALVDLETGKIASAKNPRRWGKLLYFRAEYVEPPARDEALPPVRITLPDGDVLSSTDADVDTVLSDAVGRPVHLSSEPPDERVLEQYRPDIEELPEEERDTVVDSRFGSLAPGTFQDGAPLQLLTTATLDRLVELRPEALFDPRRFRANFIIATEPDRNGFVENDLTGNVLSLGPDVRARVMVPVPRCVMTSVAQADLPRDNTVLQTIARHNRVDVPTVGPSPCAGAYATVRRGGVVSVGDTVEQQLRVVR